MRPNVDCQHDSIWLPYCYHIIKYQNIRHEKIHLEFNLQRLHAHTNYNNITIAQHFSCIQLHYKIGSRIPMHHVLLPNKQIKINNDIQNEIHILTNYMNIIHLSFNLALFNQLLKNPTFITLVPISIVSFS